MSSRPGPAARPRTPRPDGSRRGPAVTARGVTLLVVALVSAASVLAPLRAWTEQRGELAQARADIAVREQRLADLQTESDRWGDPAYVAAQARGRLHYVQPGETGYVVLGAPPDAGPSGAPVPTPTATATATAAPEDASLLQRVREGLGLGSEPVPTPTPTPADIAPSTEPGTPTSTATPGAS